MSIAVIPDSKQPLSSNRSTICSTLGWIGIAVNTLSGCAQWPDVEIAFEPANGVAQVGHERRLDGVLDDRVPLGFDPLDVLVNWDLVHRGSHARILRWSSATPCGMRYAGRRQR
jgi:hypothetical protein